MNEIKRRDFLGVLGVGATELGMARMARGAETAATSTKPARPAENKENRTFVSGREDGRFVQTAGFMQAYMKNLRPKLAFDPRMKPEDFPAWREAIRAKLPELLCFPEDVPKQPPPKQLWNKQREGYQLQKWEAYPEPFSVVPFLVLIPDGVSQQSPAPGVMCFPGSTSSKESLAGEPELDTGKPSTRRHWATNKQALFYTQKGFVSVAVENPATNETASPLRSRGPMSNCALWMGRNYLGVSVFQKACILEWLGKLPLVDPERIAASGHSLGSNPADILGILYPKLVKAVVHNDFVCNVRILPRQPADDFRLAALALDPTVVIGPYPGAESPSGGSDELLVFPLGDLADHLLHVAELLHRQCRVGVEHEAAFPQAEPLGALAGAKDRQLPLAVDGLAVPAPAGVGKCGRLPSRARCGGRQRGCRR